jgi:hypothetical protein
MISDMMDIHNAFIAKFENAISIASAVVPARFFNPQPNQKKTPVYPSIIIQPLAPKPSSRVWVESRWPYNATDKSTVEVKPPKRWSFRYQVSMYANRFDHSVALLQCTDRLFPEVKGQRFMTIDGDSYDVTLIDTRVLPSLDAGVFRTDFDYEVDVPVYALTEEAVKTIETWRITVEETTDNLL